MEEYQIEQLMDFLRCSHVGRHPGASSGEKSAYKLAKQAAQISGLLQDLDGEKKEGFLRLLEALAWPDTREGFLRRLPK